MGKRIDELVQRASDVQEELEKLDDNSSAHPSKFELDKQLKQIQRQIKEQAQAREEL